MLKFFQTIKRERLKVKAKEYFKKYSSNSVAGSSNQTYFISDDKENRLCRVFYKISASGEYNYSFLFSSFTDSSFPEGNLSKCNMKITGWQIVRASVGITDFCGEDQMGEIKNFTQLYFNGKKNKKVKKGEFFFTDEILLNGEKDKYFCLEIEYKGKKIPQHYENTIPAFVKEKGEFIPSNRAIFANMIGCDRKVKKRIAFLGDSITQGIGVENNSYLNYCALVSQGLGEEYSFWNLGIGYAMANDCASEGSWLYKAKQCDLVVLCLGVNDLFRISDQELLKANLKSIIVKLKENARKVILQTVPPFGYEGNVLKAWQNVNRYIKTELSKLVDGVFDCVPLLSLNEKDQDGEYDGAPRYGGHPNEQGCRAWAEKLLPFIKEILENN